jgi:hypothetical protein
VRTYALGDRGDAADCAVEPMGGPKLPQIYDRADERQRVAICGSLRCR